MKVLIVGRANVGKSSLFNRITHSRKALVFQEPGITRDILREKAEHKNRDFEIMDSGGFSENYKTSELFFKVREKTLQTFETADAFVLVADGRVGVQPGDLETLELVRKANKPFLFFVNKVDDPNKSAEVTADFFHFTSRIVSGSCERNQGIEAVLDWIVALMPPPRVVALGKPPDESQEESQEESQDESQEESRLTESFEEKTSSVFPLKQQTGVGPAPSKRRDSRDGDRTELFVMGKANSGKSLLCNRLLNRDRMIVCSLPGTTLDTVQDFFSTNEGEYSLTDSPGARRGAREERERLSFAKSRASADKAHIVLLVADGTKGVGRWEARLAELCLNRQKPVILVINKTDLIPERTEFRENITRQVEKTFRFYPDIPVIYVSAKTGKNREKLLKLVTEIRMKTQFQVSTSRLNDFFFRVIRKAPAPVYGSRDVKFYYVTQTRKIPPSFIAFANCPEGVSPSYKKFVINQIKKRWSLQGVPVQFHALPKTRAE